MHNYRNLRHLMSLALLGALMEHRRTEKAAGSASGEAQATPGASGTATLADAAPNAAGLPDPLAQILSQAFPGAEGCSGCGGADSAVKSAAVATEIPQDIADAAGMNQPGFDITSPIGQLIGLLAAAQSQIQAQGEAALTAADKARLTHAGASIGVAICLIGQ